MIKKIFFQIHWFLGITAGLILSIMGITGAIYSYDQQILKWINQDSYIVVAQDQDKLSPAELYQHFTQQDPTLKINSITIAKDPTSSSTVNIVKEGERRGYNMMVNPYNAEVLPEVKGREFFQFIQRLHRYLTMGDFGKQLTGASTLMLIFFVLSGIYLRWPKKHSIRQWLFVKPKLKGRNFIWDLHAVVGTWVIFFYLMFAVTGLYWSYDWWRSGMFKVMGVERPQMQGGSQGAQQQGNPLRGERPASGERSNQSGRGSESQNPNLNRGEQSVQGGNPERGPRGEGRGNREQADLSPAQIELALTQTWTGFNQQIGRDYSAMTLNIPKQDNGKVDISFIDVIPQHERARNSATYNYQVAAIEKMELYEDKKLNEKIMSSMLPVHRGSFFGGTYQFIALLASLAMPLFFVTGWMLYLKRRKQKKLTQAARSSSNVVHLDPNAEQWTILYASQTGMAEQIAYNTSTALQQAGVPTQVKALKDSNVEEIAQLGHVLFVVSTYGTGEAPDLAANFAKKNLQQAAAFPNLKYAVLALGSKEYAETYCTFGHHLDHWLKQSEGQPVFNIVEVDNGNKTDLERWYTALANITHKEVQAVISEKVFDHWALSSRQLLNAGSQGEPAFDLQLQPLHDEFWHAGDIMEVQPENDSARISAFIQQHDLNANSELMLALRIKNLTKVKTFNAENIDQLENLPAREYSIASIPAEGFVRLVIRQKQCEEGSLGLGSGWLTEYAEVSGRIEARIRTNPSFHLIDDNRPTLFIGNGTGIAGLLSLLKRREQLGFNQNWLVFGERQQAVDFFYQEQIRAWQASGHLPYVDLAFSRDQEQRIYVQDKLIERQEHLKTWIAQGAVLYVCGSIEGMASGVEQALIDILGEEQVNDLRQHDRYRRDVY